MEEIKNSAGKEHLKGFLKKRKVNEPCKQKIVDDSKAGGGKIKKAES